MLPQSRRKCQERLSLHECDVHRHYEVQLIAPPNGVAERFIRTLKERAIYGRIFEDLEEVRQAVAEFVARYNHQWRVEKNGF